MLSRRSISSERCLSGHIAALFYLFTTRKIMTPH